MNEDIKDIKEILELAKEEIENNDENITATLDLQDLKSLKNLYDFYNKEKEKNKELEEENRNIKNYIYYKEFVEQNYIPNERLIHYMDVALENSKQYLKKGNKVRANEEYKRYKDLKDIVDDLVYHKTLIEGDK